MRNDARLAHLEARARSVEGQIDQVLGMQVGALRACCSEIEVVQTQPDEGFVRVKKEMQHDFGTIASNLDYVAAWLATRAREAEAMMLKHNDRLAMLEAEIAEWENNEIEGSASDSGADEDAEPGAQRLDEVATIVRGLEVDLRKVEAKADCTCQQAQSIEDSYFCLVDLIMERAKQVRKSIEGLRSDVVHLLQARSKGQRAFILNGSQKTRRGKSGNWPTQRRRPALRAQPDVLVQERKKRRKAQFRFALAQRFGGRFLADRSRPGLLPCPLDRANQHRRRLEPGRQQHHLRGLGARWRWRDRRRSRFELAGAECLASDSTAGCKLDQGGRLGHRGETHVKTQTFESASKALEHRVIAAASAEAIQEKKKKSIVEAMRLRVVGAVAGPTVAPSPRTRRRSRSSSSSSSARLERDVRCIYDERAQHTLGCADAGSVVR